MQWQRQGYYPKETNRQINKKKISQEEETNKLNKIN